MVMVMVMVGAIYGGGEEVTLVVCGDGGGYGSLKVAVVH